PAMTTPGPVPVGCPAASTCRLPHGRQRRIKGKPIDTISSPRGDGVMTRAISHRNACARERLDSALAGPAPWAVASPSRGDPALGAMGMGVGIMADGTPEVEIHPVTPDRWDDVVELFERK